MDRLNYQFNLLIAMAHADMFKHRPPLQQNNYNVIPVAILNNGSARVMV